MPEKKTIESWKGEFGDKYIERNELEEWKISIKSKVYESIFKKCDIRSLLEVGSNVGMNLAAMNRFMGKKVEKYAVEPNKTAYGKLMENADAIGLKDAWNCDAFNLPLPDGAMDLVFTGGVLIHIHPKDLGRAVDEIHRVSKKYIFCIEYFSDEPEEKAYRGEGGLLFKRDFGSYYLDRFKDLECIDYGFLWKRKEILFDNGTWWLFQKSSH